MLARILGWFMKSKTAKIGIGTIGGSGLVALLLAVHADVTGKLNAHKSLAKESMRIAKVEYRRDMREYVKLTLQPVQTEISNLKDEAKETKDMVRDIHNYLLKRN